MPSNEVQRATLLCAMFGETKHVGRVEVQRITLPAGQPSPLHTHPYPVVGIVTSGRIRFQVADGVEQILETGDAFHEPADTLIPHFDAHKGAATFVAFYLLDANDTELITIVR